MQYANDEARYEFPIRLCPAYQQVLQDYCVWMDPGGSTSRYTTLSSIDDVRDVLDTLGGYVCGATGLAIGEGEESVNDLYRLCQRIDEQYRAAQRY